METGRAEVIQSVAEKGNAAYVFQMKKAATGCIEKKEADSMGTVLVGAILVSIIGLVIRGMIRDKKNGKSIQCGGDCKHCGGHCGH